MHTTIRGMKSHVVTAKQDGIRQDVLIDGQPVGTVVSGLTISMAPSRLPLVELQLVPLVGDFELKQADVVVALPEMPEQIERVLLAQLKAKYEA